MVQKLLISKPNLISFMWVGQITNFQNMKLESSFETQKVGVSLQMYRNCNETNASDTQASFQHQTFILIELVGFEEPSAPFHYSSSRLIKK